MPELKRPRGPREEAHFPSLWGWNRLLRKLLYVMQGLNVLLENLMKRPTEARDLHPPRHRLPDPEEERAPAPRTPTRTTSEASWERMSLNSELLQASPGSSQGDVTQLLEEMKEIVGPPPKCGHGRLCRLFLSRTAKNNRRLFWRCPMDRQGQCSTFQWCNRQPLRPDLDHLEEPSPQPMRRGAPSSSTTPQVPPLPRRCPHRNISRAGTNAFKIMEKCLDCNRTLVDEPTPLGMEKAQKRREQKDQKSLYITRLTRQHPGAQYQEGYPPPRYPIYQEDMNNLTPAMAHRLQQYPTALVDHILKAYKASISYTEELYVSHTDDLFQESYQVDRLMEIMEKMKYRKKTIMLNDLYLLNDQAIYCDLGKEFKGHFELMADQNDIYLDPGSLEMPTQRAITERAGRSFKEVLSKTLMEAGCSSWDEWHLIVDEVNATMNRLSNKSGFSPIQRMLGYSPRLPGGIFQGGEGSIGVMSRYHAGDAQVQRSTDIRTQAAVAFHQVECEQALKHSVYAGPKRFYDYEVGQTVYFWRKGMERQKKDSPAFWHGPGKVILTDLPNTIWVSYRGTLVKAAPEHLRPITNDEKFQFMDFLTDIVNTQKEIQNHKIRNYIILDEKPPAIENAPLPEQEEDRDRPDEEEPPPPKKPRYRIEGKTAETEVEFKPEEREPALEGDLDHPEPMSMSPRMDDYTPTEPGDQDPHEERERRMIEDEDNHKASERPTSPRSTPVIRERVEDPEPPVKRIRTEALELLYQELVRLRPQKGKEIVLNKLPAKKKEKFLKAILKEVTNNLSSGTTTFFKSKDKKVTNQPLSERFLQLAKKHSQGGYLLFYYHQDLETSDHKQDITIAGWKSYKLKRCTVNTLSAECQSMLQGIGNLHWHRFLLAELFDVNLQIDKWESQLASFPFVAATDSKSLYDTMTKCRNTSAHIDDKRTGIDLTILKRRVEQLHPYKLRRRVPLLRFTVVYMAFANTSALASSTCRTQPPGRRPAKPAFFREAGESECADVCRAIKTTDKKGIYLAEHVDDSLDTPEIDEADSEYEVLMAAAEELGLDPATSAPDEEIFEESDAKEILATMVRDHVQGKGRGKSGGKRTFQQAGASKEVQLLESDEALFIHFLEMHQQQKRSRAMEQKRDSIPQWRRLALRLLLMIRQMMISLVSNRLHMSGPPGMRTRLVVNELENMSESDLEVSQEHLQEELEQRRLEDFSLVSGGKGKKTQGYIPEPAAPKTPERPKWEPPSPVMSPSMDSNQRPPLCHCHLTTTLQISRKEGYHFHRQFWTCPRWETTKSCGFFMWTKDQPFWSPSPNKKGVIPLLPTADPQTAKYPMQMDPKICPHYNVTKAGSNGWIEQTRCIDCQTILERKQRTKPASAASSHQDSAIPGDQQAWEEFQEFKQFCQMQRRRQIFDLTLGDDLLSKQSQESAQRYPPGLVNTILKSYAQSINRPEKELYFILAADIISLDRQVDEHYYTSEETAEIFAEGEDLIPALDAPFYGSQENEFTIQAKEHLPEGDWKFWTRTDLQADKYQTTKGDGPHFNLVDYRLTFNLETKELIKLESVSDLNSEDLEKALESENQNIEETMTLSSWLEGLTELRDQLRRPDIRGLIDLSEEAPPTQDELGEFERKQLSANMPSALPIRLANNQLQNLAQSCHRLDWSVR
ncbi:unnamed protein product [Durusdinium trenchii]|uniref:Uncharacterized protein n=1 Tax=Durusdinium trenchii TaxID=1381693 RepID=A0ABP0J634_9DINO